MEPTAECLHDFDRFQAGLRRLRHWFLTGGGPDRHGRRRLSLRTDGKRFRYLVLWLVGRNCMHDRLRFMTW
jgi:hypothetical protein